MAAAIKYFHMRVGYDNGESRQFGAQFDPVVPEENVEAFLELIKNTLVNIYEDVEVNKHGDSETKEVDAG